MERGMHMTIFHLFSLLGGLGLFLYGMWIMREHLNAAAGTRMQQMLRRMTATRFRGFLAGIGITSVLQSSSAVMVLLVGLTDAGILSLQQAVGVILGANIGTTITCQLIALDAEGFAPLLAFVGIMLLLFARQQGCKRLGGILAGIGVMFIGLTMMGDAVQPLEKEEWFLGILAACKNPAAGILAGTLVTSVLQSSSASIAILQTLARRGMTDIHQSIYIVFGQNMGTCVTGLLAAAGAGIHARRTAVAHLMVNVFGTILFLLLTQMLPVCSLMECLTPGDGARQIADIHTVFNVVTSLLLLPFGNCFAGLIQTLMPERDRNARKKR